MDRLTLQAWNFIKKETLTQIFIKIVYRSDLSSCYLCFRFHHTKVEKLYCYVNLHQKGES